MTPLLFNVAALTGQILVVFVLYGFIDTHVPKGHRPLLHEASQATLFALVGLYALSAPIELLPGVIADPRGAILACACLFGGWRVGLVTTLAMVGYRLAAGGAGAGAGALGMAVELACLLALLLPPLNRWLSSRAYPQILVAAVAMSLLEPWSLLLIPPPDLGRQFRRPASPWGCCNSSPPSPWAPCSRSSMSVSDWSRSCAPAMSPLTTPRKGSRSPTPRGGS